MGHRRGLVAHTAPQPAPSNDAVLVGAGRTCSSTPSIDHLHGGVISDEPRRDFLALARLMCGLFVNSCVRASSVSSCCGLASAASK